MGLKARVVQELFGKSIKEAALFLKDSGRADRARGQGDGRTDPGRGELQQAALRSEKNVKGCRLGTPVGPSAGYDAVPPGTREIASIGGFGAIVKDALGDAMVGLGKLSGATAVRTSTASCASAPPADMEYAQRNGRPTVPESDLAENGQASGGLPHSPAQ